MSSPNPFALAAHSDHMRVMDDRPPRFRRSHARRERQRLADRRDTRFVYALILLSGLAVLGLIWVGTLGLG